MHIPVLLKESIAQLSIEPGDVVIDGTFGGGGHSVEILNQYKNSIRLICVDLDEAAEHRYRASPLQQAEHATFVHANFKDVDTILTSAGVTTVNKVLLDLGTSTFQLLEDTRGFSFQSDAALRMSFSEVGSHTGFNAYDIVNTWEAASIADIIYYYGEEPKARQIAKAIVAARDIQPIKTAKELAEIIATVIPKRSKINPATKTFQALRIAVNDELAVLRTALDSYERVLAPKGRIAVITFHSLEDRIVKQWMASHKNVGRVITKKPITPTRSELLANKRARSAKLRVYEKEYIV